MSARLRPVFLLIPIAMIVLLLVGCVVPVGFHRSDLQSLQANIQNAIPIGTTSDDAMLIMEKHGYKCRYSTSSEILCSDTGNVPLQLFDRTWLAHFDLANGRVKSYVITTNLNAS